MDASIRSARVDALFAETATISRYLQVEVALAQTEATLGIIPERAAQAIAASATVENIDRERYRQDFATETTEKLSETINEISDAVPIKIEPIKK